MTQRRRTWLAVLGGALAAGLLALAVLFSHRRWYAEQDVPVEAPAARAPLPPPPAEPGEAPPAPPPPEDVLAALGIDRQATPHCAQIWIWASQRVPGWVITDNIEAQAMLFDERELACLTATPKPRPEWIPELPGGILQMAEARPRYSQPRGP